MPWVDPLGLAQDLEQAAQWFLKAAEQDHVRAQYSLALSYLLGEGVRKDAVDALQWFLLAAAHGDPDASAEAEKIKRELTTTQISAVESRVERFRASRAQK